MLFTRGHELHKSTLQIQNFSHKKDDICGEGGDHGGRIQPSHPSQRQIPHYHLHQHRHHAQEGFSLDHPHPPITNSSLRIRCAEN